MDRAKAKRLLKMLQERTEQRGATAAEAAQAAELAAKIIERYGLDAESTEKFIMSAELGEGQWRRWATLLGAGIARRFSIEVGRWKTPRGVKSRVQFSGPEHQVRVAVWLFRAVEKDMRRMADAAAIARDLSGPEKLSFKNEFMLSAAWCVHTRLNPPTEAELTEYWEAQRGEDRSRRSKHYEPKNADAFLAGAKAGEAIKLDAGVLPGEQTQAPRIERRNRAG